MLLSSSSHIYQTRRGSSNLVDVNINAIVASKILELLYWPNELLPKRRVSINAKPLHVIKSLLVSEILLKKVFLHSIMFGQWRKKNEDLLRYESHSYKVD